MRIKTINIIIAVSLAVSIFGSCIRTVKKEYQFYLTDFKKSKSIDGTIFNITNVKKPLDICVIPEKNLLLVTDVNNSYFVYVYELSTLKFKRAIAKKGIGPNEQLDCHKVQCDVNKKYLYTKDLIKRKVFIYLIDDILNTSLSSISPISDLPLDINPFRPIIMNDQIIVDFKNNFTGKDIAVFNFYSKSGALLYSKSNYPMIKEQYKNFELNTVFSGGFNLSEDGKNIILSYFNTDFIDLYDNFGNLKKRIQGPDIFDPNLKSKSYAGGQITYLPRDSRKAYKTPRMSGNDIYVLYDGRESSTKSYHVNRLFNFNRDLTPKTVFTLSEPIFAFDINWKTQELYGITNESTLGNIIKYKLN